MTLDYAYRTAITFSQDIGQHHVLLRCMPAQTAFQQNIRERLVLPSAFRWSEGCDAWGNRYIIGSTREPHHDFTFSSEGTVRQSVYCIPEVQPHPIYSYASRLTVCTDEMAEALLPVRQKDTLLFCLDIAHAVHQHLAYIPGATGMDTSAREAYGLRQGVCQDYAHLMVAVCRKAGITARYANGLMQGEGETHAWVEIHDGHCWYAFDPTNDTAIASGYVKLAHGRDAADCPVCRGTFVGCATQRTDVSVFVK